MSMHECVCMSAHVCVHVYVYCVPVRGFVMFSFSFPFSSTTTYFSCETLWLQLEQFMGIIMLFVANRIAVASSFNSFCFVSFTRLLDSERKETYPSTPPVWFAESEETSVTNAVQILSNTDGQNNHVLNQVSGFDQNQEYRSKSIR